MTAKCEQGKVVLRPVDYLVMNLKEVEAQRDWDIKRAGCLEMDNRFARRHGMRLRSLYIQFSRVFPQCMPTEVCLNGDPNEVLMKHGTATLNKTTGEITPIGDDMWGRFGRGIIQDIIKDWNNRNRPEPVGRV